MDEWKFYIRDLEWAFYLYACQEDGGFRFNRRGIPYYKFIESSWKNSVIQSNVHNKLVSLEQVLSKIPKNIHLDFFKLLKISPPNLQPITPEIQDFIVKELIKKRATNGDAAHKFKDDGYYGFLYQLTEKGILGEIGGKYWLKESENNS